jgi:DNA gyrase/topoisomerase IV subunit B
MPSIRCPFARLKTELSASAMRELFEAIRKRPEMWLGRQDDWRLRDVLDGLLGCPIGTTEVTVRLQPDGSLVQDDGGVGISTKPTSKGLPVCPASAGRLRRACRFSSVAPGRRITLHSIR